MPWHIRRRIQAATWHTPSDCSTASTAVSRTTLATIATSVSPFSINSDRALGTAYLDIEWGLFYSDNRLMDSVLGEFPAQMY